jgi:SAM-dependent MidA family methyltransferase
VAPDAAELLLKALGAQAVDRCVRFDRFMETVLYHPELGYYARSESRAGRQGDFLTSPEVAPLFGECVAAWIEEVWSGGGRPSPFHVVEAGAGRGTLAAAVAAATTGELAPHIRFHLVERGAAPRGALEERMRADARVRVYASVDVLPARLGAGVFVANELFDNLPVRRLMMADGWKEIHVRISGRRLREELLPAPEPLVAQARAHGLALSEGQSGEVSEGAVPLLESILSRFTTGGLLLFDYGGEAAEMSGDAAPNGTVAAHRGHAAHPDLYSDLGGQDVTAHVNFTPLRQAAERLGYGPCHFATQAQFLLERGLPERLVARVDAEPDPFERLRLSQFAKQLYHPEAMGESFRVLYATKRQ